MHIKVHGMVVQKWTTNRKKYLFNFKNYIQTYFLSWCYLKNIIFLTYTARVLLPQT